MRPSSWRVASRRTRIFHPTNLQQIRNLLTFAIETSCDDTAVAVLESNGTSAKLHFNAKITANNGEYTGIHPVVALESHQKNLPSLIQSAIEHLPSSEQHGKLIKPDFISVTRGPGMRASLNNGVGTAKGLALAWNIPIVGVHHMQAHALTPRLCSALKHGSASDSDSAIMKPTFPFLSLLVSGGHTMLIHSASLTSHKILANTTDIAIGDMLDKAGRSILPPSVLSTAKNTAYGALLESYAFPDGHENSTYSPPKSRREEYESCKRPSPFGWPFPLPLMVGEHGKNAKLATFSFSGIDTYVQRLVSLGWDHGRNRLSQTPRATPIPDEERRYLAKEALRVAFEHLASRIVLVLEDLKSQNRELPTTLVVSGGVASNNFLRRLMRAFLAARGFPDIEIVAPPVQFCTDNAAMIGWAGLEMYQAGFRTPMEFGTLRKWSLENLEAPEMEEDSRDVLARLNDKKVKEMGDGSGEEPSER